MRGNKGEKKFKNPHLIASLNTRNNEATNTDADSKALAKHHLTREHGNRD